MKINGALVAFAFAAGFAIGALMTLICMYALLTGSGMQ